ncbi:MAG: molybdopterin-dependent oxidoreductase [Candidatus Eisenbacteria bacterium]|nr:molybdopterin-dependent oxidoreductase [Candidatus Eisenbacteria bacterium]
MSKNGETIRLEINGRAVNAPAGVTVHRAAEMNGIRIPTLCSHKDLSPYGGCRLCIVEIEGLRGYPLSCNTEAKDGMKVLTDTVAIREIRREVLQLILSEHPSSCLVCGEAEECKEFSTTVRKSGVATGCRWCPNDKQCELQDLVEELGIEEIQYPVLYKGYEPERGDPFFDRDYNICILCGRCIRMCQEMRGTAVLSFNFRGNRSKVGPAYDRSHIEAGCEFCGACITVCPTGALAEKASKWDGKPDDSIVTTCPYCAIGCQMEYLRVKKRFSSAVPVLDPEVNDGQACVKGRFCVGEVTHHFDRSRKPFSREGAYWKEKDWDEAIDLAAGKLKGLRPGAFSMIVSPDCTNESLYAAGKFTRSAMGVNAVDCTARDVLGGGLAAWAGLLRRPVSIQGIHRASRILAVGLDTRFNFSIIGVEIRKAMQRGARLVTIGPRESNLARYADLWLRTEPGTEGTLVKALASGEGKERKAAAKPAGADPADVDRAAEILGSGEDLTVIVGPAMFRYSATGDLIAGLETLLERENVSLIPLYTGANTRGALEMGVFPELLPGPVAAGDSQGAAKIAKAWSVDLPADTGVRLEEIRSGAVRPEVIWLVGAHPGFERPDCDFLIVQDIFEPDFPCDLFLPAAGFAESEGTLTNVEGRVQAAPRIEELPDSVQFGRVRPDWWILGRVARALGAAGFDWESAEEVRREIAGVVDGFPEPGHEDRAVRTLRFPEGLGKNGGGARAAERGAKDFLLVLRPNGYTHRGTGLTARVEGLAVLQPENGFFLSAEDAENLGVKEGDRVRVRAGDAAGTAPARIEPELPRGVVYLYVPESVGGLADRKGLADLYRLNVNPCPVEVTKDVL